MLELDDMELFQLQFCMQQTKSQMMMGGEIRRHASITQKIEEEMERRKSATAHTLRKVVYASWMKILSACPVE